jgi:hypothetical protein
MIVDASFTLVFAESVRGKALNLDRGSDRNVEAIPMNQDIPAFGDLFLVWRWFRRAVIA